MQIHCGYVLRGEKKSSYAKQGFFSPLILISIQRKVNNCHHIIPVSMVL